MVVVAVVIVVLTAINNHVGVSGQMNHCQTSDSAKVVMISGLNC